MKLRKKPFKPNRLPVTPVLPIPRGDMPDAWLPYCSSDEHAERVA